MELPKTNEELEKMESGSEMDILMYEVFLKEKEIEDGFNEPIKEYFLEEYAGYTQVYRNEIVRPGKIQDEKFYPSTDIDSTMIIALDLSKREGADILFHTENGKTFAKCESKKYISRLMISEYPAEAIAKALLSYKMDELEEINDTKENSD